MPGALCAIELLFAPAIASIDTPASNALFEKKDRFIESLPSQLKINSKSAQNRASSYVGNQLTAIGHSISVKHARHPWASPPGSCRLLSPPAGGVYTVNAYALQAV